MNSPAGGSVRGVGIGHRSELAAALLADPSVVDFVEVVAESCFTQKSARAEASALREVWPVIPHGVKLSLGSARGVDSSKVERLARLAKELRAPLVSEHVAFTEGEGREIGHLTQLPRTRETLSIVAKNVLNLRRKLPDVPLLLENVAFSFLWPEDEMDEGSFYTEVVERTGCDLLLDVSNLYANAVNEGNDPFQVLEQYPLERVGMVHVAGGVWEDGFYFDTHADPISDPIFGLVERVLRVQPGVPVMIERDAHFEHQAELFQEISRLRRLPRLPSAEARSAPLSIPKVRVGPDSSTLRQAQAEVALLLTQPAAPSGTLAEAIGNEALTRARTVLARKRVDDAMPLVPELSRLPQARELALRHVAQWDRAARGNGPRDAYRIAKLCMSEPELRPAALLDELVLRARFVVRGGNLAPRALPFVGRSEATDGVAWVARKGFGRFASVKVSERVRGHG